MIIEIKDLPSDRKVKHITFDITFEEDGTPIVKSTPVVPLPFPVAPITPSPVYGPIETQPPWTVTCDTTASASVQHREHKDIPPEMKDMEF